MKATMFKGYELRLVRPTLVEIRDKLGRLVAYARHPAEARAIVNWLLKN